MPTQGGCRLTGRHRIVQQMPTVSTKGRFLRSLAQKPGDILLALGLLAFSLAEISGLTDIPRHVAVVGAVMMTIPLLWRRRMPVAVLAVVFAAFSAQTLLGVPHNAQLASLAAILVASYSVGAHSDTRTGLGGLALGLVLAVATVPANPGWSISDFGFVGLVVGGAWSAGRLVWSRAVEARTHESRAAELAATAEERARQAIEAERRRIARELHDIVAHGLSLMVLQAGAAEEIVKSDPSGAVEPLRTIQHTGRSALTDMKLLLGVLRGPEPGEELRPQPTIDDIADLVDQVRTTGLPVDMRVAGASRPVGAGVALSAFRIVQEALTNVIKHAPDTRVRVTLEYGEEELDVEVTNTAGSSVGTIGSESGLRGMRERTELFGGRLTAGPIPYGGFRVHARFPLDTSGEVNDPHTDL